VTPELLKLLSVIGVVLSFVGAICFCFYEVFRPFRGPQFGGVSAGNADTYVHPTPEFSMWEARRLRLYRIGACMLVLGSGLQFIVAASL